MGLSFEHLDDFVTLLFGVTLAIWAIVGFVKQRHIFVMVLSLSLGAVLMAAGLLNLLGFIDPKWVSVSRNAVVGVGFIWTSVSALYSPPQPKFPLWTQWAMLVFGVGSTLSALVVGLGYF